MEMFSLMKVGRRYWLTNLHGNEVLVVVENLVTTVVPSFFVIFNIFFLGFDSLLVVVVVFSFFYLV